MGRGWRRESDRGAAAVEFALVLPLLLLLVFGIIDFGRMLNAQERLTAAARAGAQAVLVGGDADQARRNIFPAGTMTVVHRCGNDPGMNEYAQVTVTLDFQFVTPIAVLAGITGSPTLSATGAVPCRS